MRLRQPVWNGANQRKFNIDSPVEHSHDSERGQRKWFALQFILAHRRVNGTSMITLFALQLPKSTPIDSIELANSTEERLSLERTIVADSAADKLGYGGEKPLRESIKSSSFEVWTCIENANSKIVWRLSQLRIATWDSESQRSWFDQPDSTRRSPRIAWVSNFWKHENPNGHHHLRSP